MPEYLFDSDTVSLFVHHEIQQPRLVQRILSTPSDSLWISVVTVEEALQGTLALINNPKTAGTDMYACDLLRRIMREYARFRILPYDESARRIFKNMTAAEKRVGKNDCKIAAVAILRGLIVVTRNTKDFIQINGVVYEDWTQP